MYLETFFSDYLTRTTKREKLVFLYEEAQKLIDIGKGKEASLISMFIELLNDNSETLGKMFNSNQSISDNELIHLIAKGNYFLIKGHKENNLADLQNSTRNLESARLQAANIPYITIRLASAYRYIATLTKGERETKKNFNESVSLITESLNKVKDNKVVLSYFYNELGNTYLDMREYENAEKCFTKAKDTNEELPFAYTGMGNFYRSKNEYMRAIEHYNQALERFQYNKNNINIHKECVYPLNYLGDCYRLIEDYGKAEEMYTKAIYVDPNHPYPWHGLGRVHYELGNRNCNNKEYYEIAMEYFKKSEKLNPRFKYVLSSLGSICYKMEIYEEAKRYYTDAIKQYPKSKYHDEWAEKRKTEIRDKVILDKKIKNIKEKGYSKRLLPEEKIIFETIDREFDKRVTLMKNNFAQTFLKAKFYDNPDNKEKITLEILRRWNSYTPIITENSKGGGYFINAYDKGIVIDPGFNFIDNFKETGHVFSDIDIVLLSHAHDDHTADLESIINLLYQYNKELIGDKLLKQIAKEKNTSIYSINKDDDNELNKRYNKFKKVLYLYISEGVMKKYLPYFEKGVSEDERDGYILKDGQAYNRKMNHTYVVKEIKLENEQTEDINISEDEVVANNEQSILLTPIKANHDDVIKKVEAVGYIIDFNDTVLIYTGDTGWSLELEQKYKEIGEQFREKGKQIVLLAHIGGFKEKENNLFSDLVEGQLKNTKRDSRIYDKDNRKSNLYLYDNHLGRIGIVKMNAVLKPNLCIVSEFGEEFKGLRKKVVEAIGEAFNRDEIPTCFIPADIGLKIDLKEVKVKVISHIDYEKRLFVYEYVSPGDIAIGEYQKLNQLFYFTRKYGVTENDCLQAFYDDFTEGTDDYCTIEKHRYLKKLLLDIKV